MYMATINIPSLINIDTLNNTIDVQYGESVEFSGINCILSGQLSSADASNILKMHDTGTAVSVDMTDTFPSGVGSVISGTWTVPATPEGYSTSAPSSTATGLVLTSTIENGVLLNYLNKMAKDNLVYQVHNDYNVPSYYLTRGMNVAISDSNVNVSQNVSAGLLQALSSDENVRLSIFEQLFRQDGDRFDGVGVSGYENIPFQSGDELRFIVKFSFASPAIQMPPASMSSTLHINVSKTSVVPSIIAANNIKAADRIVEFRLTVV